MTKITAIAILLLGASGCQANSLGQSATTTATKSSAAPTTAGSASSARSVEAALPLDSGRAKRAAVVLRVERIAALGADKYGWDVVLPLRVLKNETSHTFDAELRVAHYSWKLGVPAGISTIYLEPYAGPTSDAWRLLDADGAVGVSHASESP